MPTILLKSLGYQRFFFLCKIAYFITFYSQIKIDNSHWTIIKFF